LPDREDEANDALATAHDDIVTALSLGEIAGDWIKLTPPAEAGPPAGHRSRIERAAFASYRADDGEAIANANGNEQGEWAIRHGYALYLLAIDSAAITAWASGDGSARAPQSAARNIEQVVTYATGAAGRPSSAHLVAGELARRLAGGEASTSLRAEADYLAKWLTETHPGAAPMTSPTIRNRFRADFASGRDTKPDSKSGTK
jgi:hypothetical protein